MRGRPRSPHSSRLAFLLLAGLSSLYGVIAGCSNPEVQPVVTVEGGIADASAGPQSWGASGCGGCVVATCVEESTACRAEPTCARHLECMATCVATEEGEPDSFCVSACPKPVGSAATAALADFERCRTNGAGVACEGCLARGTTGKNPLLTQVCPNPTWDAGPDADSVAESCQKCVGERCCGSRDRCRADPECAALRACNFDCGGPDGGGRPCSDGCIEQHESVVGKYYEFINCATIRCPDECGIVRDKCSECLSTTCGSDFINCESQNDCALLLRCYGTCEDDGCERACDPLYPTGRDPLARLLLCVQSSCLGCL